MPRCNRSLSRGNAEANVQVATNVELFQEKPEIAGTTEPFVEATTVMPEVLRTAIDRTVVFRNHSGRSIAVSFLGYRGMHHVSEVSGQLPVVFHLAGRHPYVVTFGDSEEGHLHGVVEIRPDLSHERDPRVCNGLKIMGACIER